MNRKEELELLIPAVTNRLAANTARMQRESCDLDDFYTCLESVLLLVAALESLVKEHKSLVDEHKNYQPCGRKN